MPFTLKAHIPTGAVEVVQPHAPRLPDLNGHTVGELSNGVWEDGRTFAALRGALLKRFPGVRIVPYTEFPVGSVEIDSERVIDQLLAKGCEAVITGNAA